MVETKQKKNGVLSSELVMRLNDYRLTCIAISIKQVLFHMKTYESKNKNYYESINNYFLTNAKNNEEAEEILRRKLQEHQQNIQALKI